MSEAINQKFNLSTLPFKWDTPETWGDWDFADEKLIGSIVAEVLPSKVLLTGREILTTSRENMSSLPLLKAMEPSCITMVSR